MESCAQNSIKYYIKLSLRPCGYQTSNEREDIEIPVVVSATDRGGRLTEDYFNKVNDRLVNLRFPKEAFVLITKENVIERVANSPFGEYESLVYIGYNRRKYDDTTRLYSTDGYGVKTPLKFLIVDESDILELEKYIWQYYVSFGRANDFGLRFMRVK